MFSGPAQDIRGVLLHEKNQGDLSQTHTILSAVEDLRELGVHLHSHAASTEAEVLQGLRPSDTFVVVMKGHDRDGFPPLESVLSLGYPTLVICRGAAASLYSSTARILSDERVTALIRNTNLRDLEANNRLNHDNMHRYHVGLMMEDFGEQVFGPREKMIPAADLNKLLTGYSLGTYPRMKAVSRSKMSVQSLWQAGRERKTSLAKSWESYRSDRWNFRQERPLDISFVGGATTNKEVITRHRKQAARALEGLKQSGLSVHCVVFTDKGIPAQKYSRDKFYEVMRQSKSVLSPWGQGEVCWRDFEAIFSGAVLIKPDMGHTVTNPTIYQPNQTYIPCKRDFSDLEDIVVRINAQWRQYQGIREHAYEVLMESRTGATIATQVAELICKGLSMHRSE